MVVPKTWVVVLFLIVNQLASGQTYDIEVSMGIPMPNELEWDDIWNVTIDSKINNAMMPTTVDINVRLELQGVIYEATTDKFVVPLGSTFLNSSIAETKKLKVSTEDQVHKTFYRRYNEMVDGTYQLCVTLNLYNPAGTILYTTSECIFHDVSHAGIIILNTPINGDTVQSELLQFTWTHATERVSELNPYYLLDLVLIKNDQSAETAIAINRKRLSIEQLTEPYMDYPQIERSLDTGQTYAWRVIAYTATNSTTRDETGEKLFKLAGGNAQEIARSEVGYFVCGTGKHPSKNVLVMPKTTYYIDLQHSPDNQTYFFSSSLPVSLVNPYGSRNLYFKLLDDQRNVIALPNMTFPLEPGLNNIVIDLSSNALKAERFYFAQITLSDEQTYILKLYKEKIN